MTQLEDTPASQKRPLAPDLRVMDDRSARAWTEAMAVQPMGGGIYEVDSQSGNTYAVDLGASRCTCPDHTFRGERCKHLRRTALEINRGEIPPPGKVEGECAACGREAFLPENEHPQLCEACHLKRGDVVRDRETGDLVVVVQVTGQRADATELDTAGVTVADYDTNRGYPNDDLVVEVVYPFSRPDASLDDLPRYSFPHSRLERRDQQLVDFN